MGASGWSYFVPYQPDLNAALQQLRVDVYRQGEFESMFTEDELTAYVESELVRLNSADSLTEYDEYYLHEYKAYLDQSPSLSENERIENRIRGLLAANAEAGTHSILDMREFSEIGGFGTVTHLSSSHLKSLFGMTKPTREMVGSDEAQNLLFRHSDLLTRWQGVCITVYEEDQPVELFFVGYSGD